DPRQVPVLVLLFEPGQRHPPANERRNHRDRLRRRPGAVLGRRRDEVFAAGDRPILVGRAGLVLQERAGGCVVEVVEAEREPLLLVELAAREETREQPALLEPRARRGKALPDVTAPRLGHTVDELRDGAGFRLGDRHELATTSAAALRAGNAL